MPFKGAETAEAPELSVTVELFYDICPLDAKGTASPDTKKLQGFRPKCIAQYSHFKRSDAVEERRNSVVCF